MKIIMKILNNHRYNLHDHVISTVLNLKKIIHKSVSII